MANRASTTILLVMTPIASNVFLSLFSFVLQYDDYSKHHWICYMSAWTALGAVATSFIGFIIHDLGPKRTLLAVLAQGCSLIFIFAGIYRGYGLIFNGQHI